MTPLMILNLYNLVFGALQIWVGISASLIPLIYIAQCITGSVVTINTQGRKCSQEAMYEFMQAGNSTPSHSYVIVYVRVWKDPPVFEDIVATQTP